MNDINQYFDYLAEQTENHLPVTSMFFGTPRFYQHILIQVRLSFSNQFFKINNYITCRFMHKIRFEET